MKPNCKKKPASAELLDEDFISQKEEGALGDLIGICEFINITGGTLGISGNSLTTTIDRLKKAYEIYQSPRIGLLLEKIKNVTDIRTVAKIVTENNFQAKESGKSKKEKIRDFTRGTIRDLFA